MQADFPLPPAQADRHKPDRVLSVSAFNRLAREILERGIPLLWVAGEISNLTRAPSGHLYFTLKDAQAQVRCTMWRSRAQLLPFRPENGMRVEARALATLYELRGDFQLNVEGLRRTGKGDLFEAFLRLKEKLSAEGLFDPAVKRPLPRFPRRIGVVTSPAAAAWHDVLAALRRRAPHLEVLLYPAPVQGDGAGRALAEAVRTASLRASQDGIDVLLLVRGGGSMEDLWAFNDEVLARAVRASSIPVVCGVGHETDFSIADFAADMRAATPTGAAELASAGYHAACARLAQLGRTLAGLLERRIHLLAQRLDRAALRLVHPRERLHRGHAEIEALGRRLGSASARLLDRSATRQRLLALRLQARRPDIRQAAERCARAERALAAAGERLLRGRTDRLAALAAHLQHLAPQAVLARGYSITRDAEGNILRSAEQVSIGGAISVQLAAGRLHATVRHTEESYSEPQAGPVSPPSPGLSPAPKPD